MTAGDQPRTVAIAGNPFDDRRRGRQRRFSGSLSQFRSKFRDFGSHNARHDPERLRKLDRAFLTLVADAQKNANICRRDIRHPPTE